MDKTDYDKYIQLTEDFEEALIDCAQEISMMSNGRELIGEWDGDTELYDGDRYLVRFETWSCGESNSDSVYVPSRYIYDIEYRKEYEKELIKEKERRATRSLELEERRKAHTYRVITDERATYEQLKEKFGDS